MKQRRLKREHGRIMSVETKVRGDALAEDAAAAATTLVVGDAADFDEDGGWLVINDQVVEYLEVDDDESTIILANGLTEAAGEGDAVHVWSTLYEEVVDYQEALVEVDGEYDNPEPVVAEVAEGVGDLPEGDRGAAGESCAMLRISDDEWEIVGVGGRGRKSRSIRWEHDDLYTLTADDVAAGAATVQLTHRPMNEAIDAKWVGLGQPPSAYTVDGDYQTVTWPLEGFEEAGDVLQFHYTYRKGIGQARGVKVTYQSGGWKHLQIASSDSTDRSSTGFDDSGWSTGVAPFGATETGDAQWESSTANSYGWPKFVTNWTNGTALWLRRTITGLTADQSIVVQVRVDNQADVYWNGTFVANSGELTESAEIEIPSALVTEGDNTLAIRANDLGQVCYLDARVAG